VSALHDVEPGVAWSAEPLDRLAARIDGAGFRFAGVESIPVHEDIKLGRPSRDRLIDAWCDSVERVGAVGVSVVCYNFMPVFDWLRTDLAAVLPDGSRTLSYDHERLSAFDAATTTAELPGWGARYSGRELRALLAAYESVDAERLWENLAYFLERVVPAAESAGVRLAIHPDDPPWPALGLPRIITDPDALWRLTRLVDSPANGVTFCTGSLGALPANDLPAMVRALHGRIHFAHCRNVRVTGHRSFHETSHPTQFGDVDMLAVLTALHETGFDGPVRPDHGRMIWDETGRPGYGLYDRALGAAYLSGLWEAVSRNGSDRSQAMLDSRERRAVL
jgi:mannonate dehydratase